MLVKTKLFGDIDIQDEKIIDFQDGIIGFPGMKKFTLIANEKEDKTSNIYWLQSLEDGSFALPVIDPLIVDKGYNPVVEDELLKPLGELNENNMSVFVTITVPKVVEKMTVNLKAPIIINSQTTKACQIILESDDFSIRYPIYDILKNKKAGD